jgi:hypothetical protein
MARLAITLLFVGVAVLGLAPLFLGGVWLARRRRVGSAPEGARAGGRRTAVVVAGLTTLVLAAGWYAAGFSPVLSPQPAEHLANAQTAGIPHVPGAVAGMTLVEQQTGDAALRAVERLHGLSFDMTAATVARYAGTAGRAELWIAEFGHADEAAERATKMADRIAEGGSPFQPPHLQAGVWATEGLGQIHYFFARGSGVWWLSADHAAGDQALAEVLTHAP